MSWPLIQKTYGATAKPATRHVQEPQGTVELHWDANLESLIHPHFTAQIARRLIKRSSGRSRPSNSATRVRNGDDADQSAETTKELEFPAK